MTLLEHPNSKAKLLFPTRFSLLGRSPPPLGRRRPQRPNDPYGLVLLTALVTYRGRHQAYALITEVSTPGYPTTPQVAWPTEQQSPNPVLIQSP